MQWCAHKRCGEMHLPKAWFQFYVLWLARQLQAVSAGWLLVLRLCTWLQVLQLDSSNVEAIACLGSFHFYTDQPEIGLRYFRRLLQMGGALVSDAGARHLQS